MDERWPNQPRAAEIDAEVVLREPLRGVVIGGKTPSTVQDRLSGMWVGIWSPHAAVANLLCLTFRRSRQLRELVSRAESIRLDCRSHALPPFLIIVDAVSSTFDATAASTRRVKATFPHSKLVGLVDAYGGDIIPLLRLGLSGLVQASVDLDADLASAITTIRQGSTWVPESVVLEHAARVQALIDCRLAPNTVLSAREARVLSSAIWGRSNKEIASILGITERTVKFHVSKMLSKLGMERRTDLLRWHAPIR